jgi:hypothetical protein
VKSEQEIVMPIVNLQTAHSLTDLAQRLYGLGAQDARLANAMKVLAAANPGLPADLSTLAPTTPIVAPGFGDLMPVHAASAIPHDVNLLSLANMIRSVGEQILKAAESGSAPVQDPRIDALQKFAEALMKGPSATPQTVDQTKLEAQFKVLSDNVAQFTKRHGA